MTNSLILARNGMPLTLNAVEFLQKLPREMAVTHRNYQLARDLEKEGLVTIVRWVAPSGSSWMRVTATKEVA